MPSIIFCLSDLMRATGTYCANRNNGRKCSRKKKVRKDVGQFIKVAKFRMSDRCTKSKRDPDAWKVMMADAKRSGHVIALLGNSLV